MARSAAKSFGTSDGHDADDLSGRHREPLDDRGAQPQLTRAMDDPHRVRTREIVGDRARAVRRVVVHDHELERQMRPLGRVEQGLDQLGQPISFVVGRHDHGEIGRAGRRHVSTIIQQPMMTVRIEASRAMRASGLAQPPPR